MKEQTIRAIAELEEEKLEALNNENYTWAFVILQRIKKLKESEEENGSK